jgi:hypothetical protein
VGWVGGGGVVVVVVVFEVWVVCVVLLFRYWRLNGTLHPSK